MGPEVTGLTRPEVVCGELPRERFRSRLVPCLLMKFLLVAPLTQQAVVLRPLE